MPKDFQDIFAEAYGRELFVPIVLHMIQGAGAISITIQLGLQH